MLSFAGDCTLGTEGQRINYPSGFVKVVEEKGMEWPFSEAVHLFENDDLTLVNLEGTFTESKKAAKKKFTFQAPPSYADILTLGSVEAVNLANNHSMDYGEQGFADTVAALDARNIAYCATGRPTVVEAGGARIALLGYCYPLTKERLSVFYNQIASYDKQPDIDLIVVSFHWGKEMKYKPMGQQVTAAHKAIDLGADVVVGTHPHVLQRIDVYKNRPIFYSLGNFSFGGHSSPKDIDSAVIQVAFDRTEAGFALARLEVFPYASQAQPLGTMQDFRPVEVGGADAERVMKKLTRDAVGLPEGFQDTGLWIVREGE